MSGPTPAGLVVSSLLAAILPLAGATAEERPSSASLVQFFEGLGCSCKRPKEAIAYFCVQSTYPEPSLEATFTVHGDLVVLLAVRMTPVGAAPILEPSDAMLSSLELPFAGADPPRVRDWLSECIAAQGRGPRPDPLQLRAATYLCSGEANAPAYVVKFGGRSRHEAEGRGKPE